MVDEAKDPLGKRLEDMQRQIDGLKREVAALRRKTTTKTEQ